MNALDWIIAAILALSVLTAMARGFWLEVLSLAGAVVGYLVAAWQYQRVAPWFLEYAKAPWVADAAAFLAVFVAVALLGGIAGHLARWVFQGAGLRWFDRLLGAAFGLLRGALVVTVLVMALTAFQPSARLLAGSRLGPYFLVFGQGASWLAPERVREGFRAGVMALRGLPASTGREPATAPATRH